MALVNNPIDIIVDKDISINAINEQVLPSGFEDYNFVGTTCAACVIFESEEVYNWLATNRTNLWFYQTIANWIYVDLKSQKLGFSGKYPFLFLTRKYYESIVGNDLTSYKPNFLIPDGVGFSKNDAYESSTELYLGVGKNNIIDHNGYGYYVPGENMVYKQTKISYMSWKFLQIDLISPNTYMVKTVNE